MKRILLVSAFGTIEKNSNSRLANIYSFLSADNDVKLITTDFDHGRKLTKPKSNRLLNEIQLKVPAYKKNISIFRLLSHIVFAVRVLKFFKTIPQKPYLIYCTMPTSLAAYFCGWYCKRYGIPFVVDVIDLWPDSLYPATRFGYWLRLVCYPWQLVTQKAYGFADLLFAESKHYLEVASKFNHSARKSFYYLGVDLEKTNALLQSSNVCLTKPKDEIWICYGGQLGTSYDFDSVLEAIKFLHESGVVCKFWFVGDGELRPKIEAFISLHRLNASITGIVTYADFLKYLSYCDIGINIFKENTKVVHSYKFNDYIATKLFVLNSLPGETSEMISEYQIGLNFDFTSRVLASVLLEVCTKWSFYKDWTANCDRLICEKLDKTMIYSKMTKKMIDLLEP